MNRVFKYIGGDKSIWMVVLFLALASMLLVYSAASMLAYKHQGGNTFFYFFKHTFFLATGIGIMYVTHRINFKYFSRISQILLWLSVPLLVLTLIMGEEVNNATRWLTIPVINQSFQTSDLAKLAVIGYAARLLSQKKEELKSFKGAFVPVMLPVVMICALILPSDLSTAAVVFISSVMLMFMAGLNWKYLFSLIPLGIVAFGLIFMIAKVKPEIFPRAETWISRVESFFDEERNPDRDYQPEMAKIAIATGEIIGKGPGNSSQRAFLPQSSSDFIYAIVIEEYGMVGGFTMLILYLILLYRSIRIVQKCERSFGAFLVLGLSFSLVFQALINMSVAVNLLPVTGQPLPLVSLGGTSVWFTCISLGVILSVSRSIEKEEAIEEERKGGNHVIA